MQFSIGVRFCKAFISKNYTFESLDSLQNVANLQGLNNLKKDLNLSFIPVIERRRLSDASKITFGLLSSDLIKDSPLKIPIIFSSQKGEINRCFTMLNDLAAHHITSPTAFSLSVLNATPALLAIAQKNHSEILAISALDSLEYGLLNAYALLYESSGANYELSPKDCLVISYEEKLHSKDISAVIACVSLDSNLPQIVLKLRKDSHESSVTYENLSSNLSFLSAVACENTYYQNGDFMLDISDFLKGFSLANL